MATESNTPLDRDSQSVVAHLEMVQSIISRMAHNSAITKTWCATLVGAILILVARTGGPFYSLIGLLPTIVFCFIDSYYLASERSFRNSFANFVERLHGGGLRVNEIYLIESRKLTAKKVLSALFSWAVWPFYSVIAVAVIAVFFLTWLCT